MVTAAVRTSLAPSWTTPCCDRTPLHLGGYRYVCRVCGAICVDTAAEVRAVFGPGVEAAIAPPAATAAPSEDDPHGELVDVWRHARGNDARR